MSDANGTIVAKFNGPMSTDDLQANLQKAGVGNRVRFANADLFADGHVPEQAITMGIGTILESRQIVLMASGSSKAATVAPLAAYASTIASPIPEAPPVTRATRPRSTPRPSRKRR